MKIDITGKQTVKNRTKKILLIFGTRPEAIKLAPLYRELSTYSDFEVKICLTAQHREMLDQVLHQFNLDAHYDLDVMRKSKSIQDVISVIIKELPAVFADFSPDLILVHGDTATTLAASISAFYSNIKIGHVEAGLRTNDLDFPWPEEGNRKLVGSIANLHFCPTKKSSNNLLAENIDPTTIHVVGNTVIDALLFTVNKKVSERNISSGVFSLIQSVKNNEKLILVTGHRRENFGTGLLNICTALAQLARNDENIRIVYPVHLNPSVKVPVYSLLNDIPNIQLIDPLDYADFATLMEASFLILTDSGGIQEEGPTLGKPVLVMRNVTERPEAVEAGTVKLIGTEVATIVTEVQRLVNSREEYSKMSKARNPFGDGNSSKLIADAVQKYFSEEL